MRKFSDISDSPRNIEPRDSIDIIDDVDQLSDIDEYQKVSVKIKVIKIDEPSMINGGLTKQDIIVADSTNVTRFTIWEDYVNQLKMDESYILKSVTVKKFRDVKYLSMSMTGSMIEKIDDIGDIAQFYDEPQLHYEDARIHSDSIIGVQHFDSYKLCITCKVKVEQTTSTFGRCTKCLMLQKLDKCNVQIQAKLLFESKQTGIITVNVFGGLLLVIAGVKFISEVTEESLLTGASTQPMRISYITKITLSQVSWLLLIKTSNLVINDDGRQVSDTGHCYITYILICLVILLIFN